FDRRHIQRRRNAVIEKARIAQTAVGAIVEAFREGPAEPLRNATLNLAFDRGRIERAANVLEGRVAQDGHLSGSWVDLDIAHVRADLDTERQPGRDAAANDGAFSQCCLHKLT